MLRSGILRVGVGLTNVTLLRRRSMSTVAALLDGGTRVVLTLLQLAARACQISLAFEQPRTTY